MVGCASAGVSRFVLVRKGKGGVRGYSGVSNQLKASAVLWKISSLSVADGRLGTLAEKGILVHPSELLQLSATRHIHFQDWVRVYQSNRTRMSA
jgi:hypothetical protein